jgi:Holliday junction resolvasome RuvABC endonuclease subunit
MSLFIGIDQSVLHTGICILNEDASTNYLGLIEPKLLVNHARLAYIRDGVNEVLKDLQFHTGVMEGYSYNSHNKKYLLGEVGAIIKLALFDRCEHYYDAAPKALKKFVCSKGSASKEDVMFAIEKQWNVVIQNDNVADAYGLARIGYEMARPSTMQRHQLDVIKKILSADLKKPRKTRTKNQFKDAI